MLLERQRGQRLLYSQSTEIQEDTEKAAGFQRWMELPACFWALQYLQNMTFLNSSQRNIWSQLMINLYVPPMFSVVPKAVIIKRECLCCGSATLCVRAVLCRPLKHTCCVCSGSAGRLRQRRRSQTLLHHFITLGCLKWPQQKYFLHPEKDTLLFPFGFVCPYHAIIAGISWDVLF